MTMESAILISMSVGILTGAVLTAWCLYSKYSEKLESKK
jgi:hypothetical protein